MKRLRGFAALTVVFGLGGHWSPAETQAPVPGRVGPNDALVPAGRFVFERNCVVCHGKWGDGRGELAGAMIPRPRRFTSGTFKFRSTPSGSLPTDADLTRTIRGGLFGTSMPSFQQLSDREVKAVIEYVKTFSRRWTVPESYGVPVPVPPAPAWLEEAAARAVHVASGRSLFQANCAPCHGPEGRGNGPAATSLEDDWGQPALPADLSLPSLKSGPEARDVYRVLATGLNGTPMPSFLESTSTEQRWDLVAYVLSLRTEVSPP